MKKNMTIERYEIVSRYINNQTQASWYKMLKDALKLEQKENWPDDIQEQIKDLKNNFATLCMSLEINK